MLLTEKDYTIKPVQVNFLEMHTNPMFVLFEKNEVYFTQLQKPIDVDAYRHYYYNVGFKWNWLDRLAMSYEELSEKINTNNIDIFVLKVNNEDAGYAEFDVQKEYVEIVYFGLFPDYIGKGLGKFFIRWVVNKAWSYNREYIQLNTCALDHPNALNVYQSVGFKIVKTDAQLRKVLAERSFEL